MLNLNLSLLTLTFFIFYSSRTTLSFSNIQWSLFCCPRSFSKADAKVLQISLPTKFFNHFFLKKFHFFCNSPIIRRIFFHHFLPFFVNFWPNSIFYPFWRKFPTPIFHDFFRHFWKNGIILFFHASILRNLCCFLLKKKFNFVSCVCVGDILRGLKLTKK